MGYSQREIIDVKYDDDERIVIDPPSKEEFKIEYAEDHIFHITAVETKPEYPEGIPAFNEFVKANFQKSKDFPEGLKGRVFVSFVVEKDGSLSNIKIMRDIGYGTGKEVVRVLKLSKKWKPGLRGDKSVRVQYLYPVTID